MAGSNNKRLRIHPDKCTGCRNCDIACASSHYELVDNSRFRIRVIRDDDHGLDIVTVCCQCEAKPCADICPVDAITINEDGTIRIADSCINYNQCKEACPFSGLQSDPHTEKVIVCDLCGGSLLCAE